MEGGMNVGGGLKPAICHRGGEEEERGEEERKGKGRGEERKRWGEEERGEEERRGEEEQPSVLKSALTFTFMGR